MTSNTVFVDGIIVLLAITLTGKGAVEVLQAKKQDPQKIEKELHMVRDHFQHHEVDK